MADHYECKGILSAVNSSAVTYTRSCWNAKKCELWLWGMNDEGTDVCKSGSNYGKM